jgi:hypothetical protein
MGPRPRPLRSPTGSSRPRTAHRSREPASGSSPRRARFVLRHRPTCRRDRRRHRPSCRRRPLYRPRLHARTLKTDWEPAAGPRRSSVAVTAGRGSLARERTGRAGSAPWPRARRRRSGSCPASRSSGRAWPGRSRGRTGHSGVGTCSRRWRTSGEPDAEPRSTVHAPACCPRIVAHGNHLPHRAHTVHGAGFGSRRHGGTRLRLGDQGPDARIGERSRLVRLVDSGTGHAGVGRAGCGRAPDGPGR